MSLFTITCAGGAQMPTGSNFLIECAGKKILIDCGLVQGEKYSLPTNKEPFAYDPASVDVLMVTHAHLDHVGRIPKLVREGFVGKIISTEPTREIGELVMLDSMGVLQKEALHSGEEQLYEEKDVFDAVRLWTEVYPYEKPFTIATSDGDITVVFHDAGHILGSATIEIEYKGRRLMFTGDLGNTPSPLMRDTVLPHNIDYLFVESVYGDRNHEDKDKRFEILQETIVTTINRGGTLIIPAFSIERTQELLQAINGFIEHGTLREIPIYLDSPLGINVTKVYKKYEYMFNDQAEALIKKGDDIFSFKGLISTPTPQESKAINQDVRPKVIIAGSGMSNGGRIVHHETKYLPDEKNTILIVGYQAANTLGRRLVEKEKKVIIHGMEVPVRAQVVTIHGFSAHKDSDNLVAFVGATKESLKKVFVILGEPKSSYHLGQRIHEEYLVPVEVPEKGQVIELD